MTSVFFPVAATVVPPSRREDLLEPGVGMAERAVASGVLPGPRAEVVGGLDRGQPRREVVVHEGADEVPGHEGRLAPRVDGDEEPDAFLLEQPELAVEIVRVPAVPDDPPAVHVRLVEAQAGPADGGLGAEDARVHGAGRLRLQDARLSRPPLLQVGDHEAGHVGGGGGQRAGGAEIRDELVAFRLERARLEV